MFRMRVSSQVPSKFPKSSGYRVSNPKFKRGKGTNSPTDKPTYGKCGKKHYVIVLRGRTIALVVGKVATRLRIALM